MNLSPQKLSVASIGKDNNCNLIRVIAAIFVIVSHSFVFLDIDQNAKFAIFSNLGNTGVNIFFILSGFLVSKSLIENRNPLQFIINRFLRIWPALILNTIILIAVFTIFAPNSINLFFIRNVFSYLYSSTILHHPAECSLPSIFINHTFPVLNGPLWTLSYECAAYSFLGILFIIGALTSRFNVIFIFIICFICYFLLKDMSYNFSFAINSLFRFLFLFLIGVTFQILKKQITLNIYYMMLSTVYVFIGIWYFSDNFYLQLIYTITLSYTIIWICFFPKKLIIYNRLGDYSYGIYIYGWPVGQVLSSTIKSPGYLTIATTVISIVFAAQSWHLVEKKALNFKKNLSSSSITNNVSDNLYHKFIWMIIFTILMIIFILPETTRVNWNTLRHQPHYMCAK